MNPDFYPSHRNLAIALYDKRDDKLSARNCMAHALGLSKNNARVLFEMQQLLKNINATPEERLALYDKYDHLVQERDDCHLDRITLLTQLGQYEQAIQFAKNHRFHIYEGGEGQLTRHHAWLHTLYAWECISHNDLAQAEQLLKQAMVLLPGYGEGKSYFAQENHVYFTLGHIYERQDRQKEMASAYESAAVDKSSLSEISLFRALALRKLKLYTQARQVLQQMIDRAEQIIDQLDQWPYFGVGSPTPLPFELDIAKTNTINGYMLKGFALLGLGKENEADEAVDVAREKAPYSFQVSLYDHIKTNKTLYISCI
jgi:tetratricopeptide (TPR) repeat protein